MRRFFIPLVNQTFQTFLRMQGLVSKKQRRKSQSRQILTISNQSCKDSKTMTTPPSKHINLRSLYTLCRRNCHRAGDPNLMTGQKICQDPRASTSKHSRLLNRQQGRLKSAPPLASNHPRESPCILLYSFQMTLLHASRRQLRQFLRSSKVFNYQEQVWTQVI